MFVTGKNIFGDEYCSKFNYWLFRDRSVKFMSPCDLTQDDVTHLIDS